MSENFLDDRTPKIVEKYHAQVDQLNANFTQGHSLRCAACNGVETLRGFPEAYRYKLGVNFGDATAATYEEGIPPETLVAADQVNRVNAHSVIARANLENGMRIGLCELVGFVGAQNPVVTFRGGTALLPDGPANRGRDFRQALQDLTARWTDQTPEDTKATDIRAALVTAMSDVSQQVSDATLRRGLLQQQCAVTRAFTLNTLRTTARKLQAPDLGAYFTNRMQTLLVYGNDGALNKTQAPILVNSFAQDLRADQTPGTVAIDNVGLSWTTIRVVEFGHQCQPCEVNQGSLDMCGRFDEAVTRYGAAKAGVRTNPLVGVAFSGLSFTAGSTVWDLSNALVAIALNQVYQALATQGSQAPRGTPRAAMLDGLTHLMTSAPSLTTLYFQCLFLELAYGGAAKILQ